MGGIEPMLSFIPMTRELDRAPTSGKKYARQQGSAAGRDHRGTLGDIIADCLGDFVGIRKPHAAPAE
jgi:hypothetical protein